MRIEWIALGFENERAICITRAGHWSVMFILPRIVWSRRKRKS